MSIKMNSGGSIADHTIYISVASVVGFVGQIVYVVGLILLMAEWYKLVFDSKK